MNQAERALIDELVPRHDELRELVDRHRAYEDQLEEMSKRRFLSEIECMEMARIKKKKLRGKDRIHRILAEHRGARLRA